MIKDQKLFDKLYKAAENIYSYLDPEHGFFAYSVRDQETHAVKKVYNVMKGSKATIEKKMGCKLNSYEEAVLAIAIGDLNNKSLKSLLSKEELQEIYDDLWGGKPNTTHDCLTFERLVTTM